jgi:ornithine cyclodeaminase
MHSAESGDLLLLSEHEVAQFLEGAERQIMEVVERAYVTHAEGGSWLPHSVFVRFPDAPRNRIIALPAYLGGDFGIAGLKWVASFPENLSKGMARASAVVVLSCAQTGRPRVILAGARINAARTAASAALAAVALRKGRPSTRASLIGCGVINREVWRFLRSALGIDEVSLLDLDRRRAEGMARQLQTSDSAVDVRVCDKLEEALAFGEIVSIATTALTPYIDDLAAVRPGASLLHLSLRDLTPRAILSCDNVVDDVDHVCRASTSLDLAQQETGHRDFIRCTLADLLRNQSLPRPEGGAPSVFSPFGLGVLDLAVSGWVWDKAVRHGVGSWIPDFLESPAGGAEQSKDAPRPPNGDAGPGPRP